MCGINGFNFKDERLLQLMLEQTKHRGPDDQGAWFDDGVSLGHNRLSIIDLSPAGHQPMASSDGRLVITYNGELYNYRELRVELEGDYPFRTKTDTEVILAAYQKWGRECVKKFNGMFAFAIWNQAAQELFLARDQIGIKPLYYYWDGRQFIFSSEIKAILKHPLALKLNKDALNMFFRLLYVPQPHTPWQNIYKFPPAHFAVVKNGQMQFTRYWQTEKFDDLKDKEEIKSSIRQNVAAAVERQLVSDRPLGLYLSGGIDSTILLGLMSEISGHKIQTFSVGFATDIQPEKYNADFEIAKKTSAYFGSQHTGVMVSARDILDNFEKVVWHADDLVSNHTQTAMYILAEATKQKVAVALSGDGGDELFTGYDRYYLNHLIDRWQYLSAWLRCNFISQGFFNLAGKKDLFGKLNTLPGADRALLFMAQKEATLSQVLNPDFNQPTVTRNFFNQALFAKSSLLLPEDSTKALQYLDLRTWLLDDALNRADRMSMAHGLEVRVPLLDKDLVELAMRIPAKYNMDSRTSGKKLFKEAMRAYLPDFVYNEPKRGFFSPVAKWLRSGLKDWAQEILSLDYNPAAGEYLDFSAIKTIFADHLSGRHYALNTLWPLLVFQVWLKKFDS